MTKRSLCFVCLALFCLTFCGCDTLDQSLESAAGYVDANTEIAALDPFIRVGVVRLTDNTWACFYRCRVTDVMYLYIDDYNAGGLSVMYDETGLPLVYSEWISSLKSLTFEP